MGIQINGQTDTVSSTTSGGSVTVTPANFPSVGNINASGISTLGVTSVTNFTSQQVNVTGISTLGVTSATNFTARQLNVSGITTTSQLNVGTGVTITSGIITATGPINLISTPFYQNNQTVSSNYTIPQSVNAMSAGPITISTGTTVVISSGGYWKIV